MAYIEPQARQLIVDAGNRLFELGLVARTWGNISARVSRTHFLITPSGIPYDKLTPDKIVLASIDDLGYEGELRPSDEIGIHADAYRIRPEVNFVIHTHQEYACLMCATDTPVDNVPEEYKEILGDFVPIGDYGLPATKKLCKGVRTAFENYPNSNAVIMKNHGAACAGKDYEDAFKIALALEEVCKIAVEDNYLKKSKADKFDEIEMIDFYLNLQNRNLKMPDEIEDLGESQRVGNSFKLTLKDGKTYDCLVDSNFYSEETPKVANIHREIYKSSDALYISHLTEPSTVALSVVGEEMYPYLDDFSQISGATIKVSEWDKSYIENSSTDIAKKLKRRNAVLIKGLGAICISKKKSDLVATKIVTDKGCRAEISVILFGKGEPISKFHRYVMRAVYTFYYSKQADWKVKN
ncbi:MAG: class II aldolase/adducin family protein [Acutalibacteraceae bacterium]|jgi:L-ribulose-5-phosphate 4-epimerase